jgi:signal transduction histidine kinase
MTQTDLIELFSRLASDASALLSWVKASFLSSLSAADLLSPALYTPLLALFALAGVIGIVGLFILPARFRRTLHATKDTIARLQRQSALTQTLLSIEPALTLVWEAGHDKPEIFGDPLLAGGTLTQAHDFKRWLPAASADELNTAVSALRAKGTPFRMTLAANENQYIDARGLPLHGQVVVRLSFVAREQMEILRLTRQAHAVSDQVMLMQTVLDHLQCCVWIRDSQGTLTHLNQSALRLLDAATLQQVLVNKSDVIEPALRQEAEQHRLSHRIWSARMSGVMGGQQCLFDVFEYPLAHHTIGMAYDITALDMVKRDSARLRDSQLRTLDQLPTAVAVFDARMHLSFCNSAWLTLWRFDPSLIEQNPSDAEILDRLHSERQLPEQTDYRAWKEQWLAAYRALESHETIWHLPDGRTLRVVVNPNHNGGVTYLFDDLTEKLNLESRFKSAMRVQTETVDTLTEAVAVFGTNGRLKLFNPSFSQLWSLANDRLAKEPHIDDIIREARPLYADEAAWSLLRGLATGLTEERQGLSIRMDRQDGTVLSCTTAPLPDGSTLFTFSDITASVNVERALKERNDALEQAGRVRDSFIHQVSYQLRSPLTNVIGFSQMLAEGHIGTLNPKQLEYASLINHSTNAVLAIIDDILDLASIDTGDMTLELSEVDLPDVIARASEGLKDRILEQKLALKIETPPQLGFFMADQHRLRQIIFNLLSNAIGFSNPGQIIIITAARDADMIVLDVTDHGRGIEPDIIHQVFDRFDSRTQGSRHRGAGLGLSLVRSFVELHGGSVSIWSKPGEGTRVTCRFPVNGPLQTQPALTQTRDVTHA